MFFSSSSYNGSLLSIQEYADALRELSPEQSEAHKQSVEKALEAARELDEIKKKLEEEKRINDERQKRENEGVKKSYNLHVVSEHGLFLTILTFLFSFTLSCKCKKYGKKEMG